MQAAPSWRPPLGTQAHSHPPHHLGGHLDARHHGFRRRLRPGPPFQGNQAAGQIGTSFEQAQIAAEHGEFMPSRHMAIVTGTPAPNTSGTADAGAAYEAPAQQLPVNPGVSPRPLESREMRVRPAIPLMLAGLALTACHPAPPAPPQVPATTPPVVRAYTQFAPGDTLELVQIQLGLNNYELRYRTSMPKGVMGMVYFLEDGNLHIDARKMGDTWVLISVPLLEPSSLSAADRAAEWDRAADPQNSHSASKR